jgi:hypothetical protein
VVETDESEAAEATDAADPGVLLFGRRLREGGGVVNVALLATLLLLLLRLFLVSTIQLL